MSLEWDGVESMLTQREREITLLVSLGRRNREIAAELGISQKTVESHIKNVLLKLGFDNRVQIATFVVQRQPGWARGRPHPGG